MSIDRDTADGLKRAHETWTEKFVDARKQAGQRVDVDAERRRAAKHVERVERTLDRK